MIVVKVKYFDHVKRDWVYLQENGADALFDSHPEAQNAIMRSQPRAYNEDEFHLEQYVVCEGCGALVLQDPRGFVCEDCGATYNGWAERIWTSYREVAAMPQR